MPHELYIVDSFTNHRFGGNPASVCILSEKSDSRWMQNVAAEMNLSETAFLLKKNDIFELKWFTPWAEVALCGHATLAAAHVLWESGVLPIGVPATFSTLSGRLTATRSGAWINMDFPSLGVEEVEVPTRIADVLGVKPTFTGRSRFDYIFELETEEEVRNASPNFGALAKETAVRGTIITAKSDSLEYDFVSRFFAPSIGVNEDPVTGSAHCCLAPYWTAKLGRTELAGYQASERGGTVRTSVRGSRVHLSGQAITITVGQLL